MKVEMRLCAAAVNLPAEPGGSDQLRPRHIPLSASGTFNVLGAKFPLLRRMGLEISA
jgi:hypothetical protein